VIPGEVAAMVDEEVAVESTIVPVQVEDNVLTLAICAPVDVDVAEKLSFKTGCSLEYVVCTTREIADAVRELYGKDIAVEAEDQPESLIEYVQGDPTTTPEGIEVEEAFTAQIVDRMLSHAIDAGASDIHIEPKIDHADVRLRIDGILSDYKALPGEQHHPVVSRIKILANLDIAERRKPQDGVIFVKYGDKDVDYRVATSPTIYGEGVVLRVLDQGRAAIRLLDLGFSEDDLAKVMRALDEPYGFVLSTGPTGSGKTTTMYAMLNKLNRSERKIITIEDPVEYRMDNINQIPVNHLIDLGFAPLLRSVLRQDPNIILVGEIRDSETAHVAVQAALTGHLLLSTLHTTDAPEVLLRLMEIGVEHYYVREVVKVIVAQRLARKLCAYCSEERVADATDLADLGIKPAAGLTVKVPKGCEHCRMTGYSGRSGIYEVMPMTAEIRDIMSPDVRLSRIRELAIEQGMRTLWQNAVDRVLSGETTLEEIKRTVPRT
jgi:type IV pilus assembly protein PilB